MRRITLYILAICLVGVSSCKKASNSSGSLSMQVNPMFGPNVLKIDSIYESPDGKYYYISLCDMVLSHIKLIQASGNMVEVNPITWFGVTDSTLPVISLGNPTGSFTGIQFSIGMDTTQDNTPVNGTANSPFFGERYWGSALKYVFVQVEGYADTNKVPVQPIGYHVGTNTYYTTVTLHKSFTLSGTGATILNINMDLQRLFYGGSNPINVLNSSEDYTSTSPVPALCQQFITNLDSAFSIQ